MHQTSFKVFSLLWELQSHETLWTPYHFRARRDFLRRVLWYVQASSIHIYGKNHKIELNSMVSIPMIVHCSVSSDEVNVHCMGAKFLINGEQHSNILQFKTVWLNMVELSILVSDQEIQELRDHTLLPLSCVADKQKCMACILTWSPVPLTNVKHRWSEA